MVSRKPSKLPRNSSEGHIPSELEELLTKPFSEEESPGWISASFFFFLRGGRNPVRFDSGVELEVLRVLLMCIHEA